MIEERKYSGDNWKVEKKKLESNGFRHANYWTRKKNVTADELRNAAMKDKISAVRMWVNGSPKIYYTEAAVNVVYLDKLASGQ